MGIDTEARPRRKPRGIEALGDDAPVLAAEPTVALPGHHEPAGRVHRHVGPGLLVARELVHAQLRAARRAGGVEALEEHAVLSPAPSPDQAITKLPAGSMAAADAPCPPVV